MRPLTRTEKKSHFLWWYSTENFFPFSKTYQSCNNSNIKTGNQKEKKKLEIKSKRHWRAGNQVIMQTSFHGEPQAHASPHHLCLRPGAPSGVPGPDSQCSTSLGPAAGWAYFLSWSYSCTAAAHAAFSAHVYSVNCVQPTDFLLKQRRPIKGYQVGVGKLGLS